MAEKAVTRGSSRSLYPVKLSLTSVSSLVQDETNPGALVATTLSIQIWRNPNRRKKDNIVPGLSIFDSIAQTKGLEKFFPVSQLRIVT
jgi:hypothetical protein